MKEETEKMIEGLSPETAKEVLLEIAKMDLDEYPLTRKDLSELLLSAITSRLEDCLGNLNHVRKCTLCHKTVSLYGYDELRAEDIFCLECWIAGKIPKIFKSSYTLGKKGEPDHGRGNYQDFKENRLAAKGPGSGS